MRYFWRDQSGSQTLELIGLMPIVMLILLGLWQFTTVGYGVVVAEAAARDAARAAAVGNDAWAAAQISAAPMQVEPPPCAGCSPQPRSFTLTNTAISGITCVQVTLTVDVPIVPLPGLQDTSLPITRTVTMPRE